MKIICSQCGAGLEVVEEEYLLVCPYCNTSLYLLTNQSFPHFIAPASLQERHIRQIIKDFKIRYNLKAEINNYDTELFYFPFWQIELQDKEQHFSIVQPAVESTFEWLNSFSPPGADFKFFNENYLEKDDRLVEASRSYMEVVEGLDSQWRSVNEQCVKSKLIHYPFIRVNFSLEGRNFSLWIDANHRQLVAFEPELPPPSLKRNFSRKFFIFSLAIFILEGILIPGNWKILAFALSFFILYRWALRKIRSM